MTREYAIGMLWVDGPLSYVEQLCIRSFLDAGHAVTLYHYGTVANVPEGAALRHGREVLDRDRFISHGRTGSMALYSDVFRYHMLHRQRCVIWADTDAYCLRPFTSETGHFFGWESAHHINGGVLGLPQDSPALAGLLATTEDEYGIPFWYDDATRARLQARAEAGDPVHVADLPWGTWGPHAITAWLHHTGEAAHALPCEVLYPVPFQNRRQMVKARKRAQAEAFLTDRTLSVHLWGRRIRDFLATRPGGLPDEGGLIDHLLKKHRIDPRAAPIPTRKGTQHDKEAT
ncbi:MAG: hypothetical protein R6V26_01720 [Roseovarius sp.]